VRKIKEETMYVLCRTRGNEGVDLLVADARRWDVATVLA
jgi:hypothetical protein